MGEEYEGVAMLSGKGGATVCGTGGGENTCRSSRGGGDALPPPSPPPSSTSSSEISAIDAATAASSDEKWRNTVTLEPQLHKYKQLNPHHHHCV